MLPFKPELKKLINKIINTGSLLTARLSLTPPSPSRGVARAGGGRGQLPPPSGGWTCWEFHCFAAPLQNFLAPDCPPPWQNPGHPTVSQLKRNGFPHPISHFEILREGQSMVPPPPNTLITAPSLQCNRRQSKCAELYF